jgi:hypothetical protein
MAQTIFFLPFRPVSYVSALIYASQHLQVSRFSPVDVQEREGGNNDAGPRSRSWRLLPPSPPDSPIVVDWGPAQGFQGPQGFSGFREVNRYPGQIVLSR